MSKARNTTRNPLRSRKGQYVEECKFCGCPEGCGCSGDCYCGTNKKTKEKPGV